MLSFHYGPMNAGKSVALLQQAHTYSEVDKHILLLVPKTMNATTISSRIGIEKSAIVIDESVDLHFFLADENQKIQISCVFIDESQFLTCEQVWQLANFSSTHQIPVKCFGCIPGFICTSWNFGRVKRAIFNMLLWTQSYNDCENL
jgi:thymidine kinase